MGKQRSKYEEKYGNLGRGQIARIAMKAQGQYVAPVDKDERLAAARHAMRAVTERVTQLDDVTQSRVTELERIVTELRDTVAILTSENERLRAVQPVLAKSDPSPKPASSGEAPSCLHCGAVIEGGTKRARYCNATCRKQASRAVQKP